MFKELKTLISTLVDFRLFVTYGDGAKDPSHNVKIENAPEELTPERMVNHLGIENIQEIDASIVADFGFLSGVPSLELNDNQLTNLMDLSYVNKTNTGDVGFKLWDKNYRDLYNSFADKYDVYYRNIDVKPDLRNEKNFQAPRQWFEFEHLANSPHVLKDQIKLIQSDSIFSSSDSAKAKLTEAIQARIDGLGKVSHEESLKAFYSKLDPMEYSLYEEIKKASIINARINANLELGAMETTNSFRTHLANITMDSGRADGAFGLPQIRASTFGEITAKHFSAQEKEKYSAIGEELIKKYGKEALTDSNSQLYKDLFQKMTQNSTEVFSGGSEAEARKLMRNMVNTNKEGVDHALRLGTMSEMMTNIAGQLEMMDRVRISKIGIAGSMYDQAYEVSPDRLARIVFEQLLPVKKRYDSITADDMKKVLDLFSKGSHGLDEKEYKNLDKNSLAQYFHEKVRENPQLLQTATLASYYYGNKDWSVDANTGRDNKSILKERHERTHEFSAQNNKYLDIDPMNKNKVAVASLSESKAEHLKNYGNEIYDIQKPGFGAKTIGELSDKLEKYREQRLSEIVDDRKRAVIADKLDMLNEALSVYNPKTDITGLNNPGLALLVFDAVNVGSYLKTNGLSELNPSYSQAIVVAVKSATSGDLANNDKVVFKEGEMFKNGASTKLSEMLREIPIEQAQSRAILTALIGYFENREKEFAWQNAVASKNIPLSVLNNANRKDYGQSSFDSILFEKGYASVSDLTAKYNLEAIEQKQAQERLEQKIAEDIETSKKLAELDRRNEIEVQARREDKAIKNDTYFGSLA